MLAAGSAKLRYEAGEITLSAGDVVLAQQGLSLRADVDPDAVIVLATERTAGSSSDAT